MKMVNETHLAQKFDLVSEWEDYKKEMEGVLDEEGFTIEPNVYDFLAKSGKILPLQEMDTEYMPDGFLSDVHVIAQTPIAIMIEYKGEYHILRTSRKRLYPIEHPFFCGWETYLELGDEGLSDGWTEKEACKKWTIWQAWEKFSKERNLDHYWLDSFLFEKGYIAERVQQLPIMDD